MATDWSFRIRDYEPRWLLKPGSPIIEATGPRIGWTASQIPATSHFVEVGLCL
jgi:hypothetical protein